MRRVALALALTFLLAVTFASGQPFLYGGGSGGTLTTGAGKSGGGGGGPTNTSWNPADAGGAIGLSNSNLTAQELRIIGFALDTTAKKVWTWEPINARWNAAAIGTQNPANGTGGYSYSTINTGSAIFPFLSLNGAATDTGIANFGASTFSITVPAGFSSWNTATSSTVTWDAGNTGTGITLSGGNLQATKTTGSAWTSTRATASLSSGKGYFEINVVAVDGANGFLAGFGSASAVLTSFIGSDSTTGGGWQSGGAMFGALSGDTGDNYANATYRSVRAVNPAHSGKLYFEVTVTTLGANALVGIADASAALGNYVGSDTHGVGWLETGQVFNNGNAAFGSANNWSAGHVLGVAVDIGNLKIWFWDSVANHWNGDILANQNPATNTGGISFSALVGTPVYPAMSVNGGVSSQDVLTANFGGSAFTQTVPAGFSAWALGN